MTTKIADVAQTLHDIRPLTNNEYDKAREEALKRITKRAGEKPTRKQFERDYGPLWTLPDYLAGLVGLSAWVISSAHVLNHTGQLAAHSYAQTVSAVQIAGITLHESLYGVMHQVGFIILAEAAMLLFMVMHSGRATRDRHDGEHAIAYRLRTFPSIPLLLAVIAALFVFVANWQSGIGILESVLPPAVTIGLGLYFEGRIAEGLHRREEVTAKYMTAMDAYEAAQQDPEKHPDFAKLHRQSIAYLLQNKRANKGTDIPVGLLKLAVVRELERERWAAEWDDQQLVSQYRAVKRGELDALPAHQDQDANPTNAAMTAARAPVLAANGNGATTGNGKH